MSSISKLVAVMAVMAPHFESADALKLTMLVHTEDPTRGISFADGKPGLPASPPEEDLSELDSIRGLSERSESLHSGGNVSQAEIEIGYPGQDADLPPFPAPSFPFPAPPTDSDEARRLRHRARKNALERTALLEDRARMNERVVKSLPVTLERLQNRVTTFNYLDTYTRNHLALVSGLVADKTFLLAIIADADGLRPLFREFLVKENATADFDFLVRLSEHWDTDDFQNGSSADAKLEEAMALINIVQGSGDMFDLDATPGASWWGAAVSKPLKEIESGKVDRSELVLDANTFAEAKDVSLRQLSEDNLRRFIASEGLSEALSKHDDPSPVRVETPAKNQSQKWSLNISRPTTGAFLSMFRRASAPAPKKPSTTTSTNDNHARRRFSMQIFGMGRASTPATAGNDVAKPHSAVMVEKLAVTAGKVPSNTASPISSGASTPTESTPRAPADELADLSVMLEGQQNVSQQVQVASVSGGGLELDDISSTTTALDGEHSEQSELSLSEAAPERAIAFNRRHARASNIQEVIAEHTRRSSELVEMQMTSTEQAITPRLAITGAI